MTWMGFRFGKNDQELMEKKFEKIQNRGVVSKYNTSQNKGEKHQKIQKTGQKWQKIKKVSTSRERTGMKMGG